MDYANHHENPELWFRPSPVLPFKALSQFLTTEEITATPRLGKRDGTHPKGYIPGTIATLRLFDDDQREQLVKRARITNIVSKPLRDLVPQELKRMEYSSNWESVQQDLSFFEGRPIASDEVVSIVEFVYINRTGNSMDTTALIDEGVLRLASLPPNNGKDSATAAFLTVPLIAENYPAKTAIMWNTVYEKFGMSDRNMMVVASPKDLPRIMQTFRADPRYRGGGAGVGFKEAVLPYLDEVTPLAKAMGAVNIIKKDEHGRLIGDNTDGVGYARSLGDVLASLDKTLEGARVLMLGAGGSGRAIAFALADAGAQLVILNRTESKARELADALNQHFATGVAFGGGRELIPSVLPTRDVVVSVIDDAVSPLDAYSTIGDMEFPVTPESIERNLNTTEELLQKASQSLIVSDIRIRKGPTAMLAQAKKLGFKTLDGIPMVVNQGVAAFWWLYGEMLEWRNIKQVDVAQIMRNAARL